jgi:alpha-1,6-mannosyltransferase
MVLLIGDRELPIGVSLAAIAVPPIVWIALARSERKGRVCDPRLVAALIGALLIAAVILPPNGSKDLWSYTMYGRMISQHWSSPYTHVPNDFPHDPFLRQVAVGWRNTPSVYGPVFVTISAAGSWLAGSSLLAARLFQQSLAAIAVAVSLALVWRRTRSPAALALLGINPVVVISLVNGGHNDALVGLAILVAALLTTTRRLVLAGIALGVGALIKVTALLALPALLAWVAWRLGRRAAVRFVVALGGVFLLGYAAIAPQALHALSGNRLLMSRASPWQIPRTLLGIGTRHPFGGATNATLIGLLTASGLGVVCVVVCATTWWRRHDSEPALSIVLALTAFLVLGAYVLPWYVGWMLPVACISLDRRSRRLAVLMSTFLTAVYIVKARSLPHMVETEWHWIGSYIGPIVVLLWCVALAVPPRTWTRLFRRPDDVEPPVPPVALAPELVDPVGSADERSPVA